MHVITLINVLAFASHATRQVKFFRRKRLCLSGWPSGLRRQTQGSSPSAVSADWAFWSTYVGVGSNPTSDTNFFQLFSFFYANKRTGTTTFPLALSLFFPQTWRTSFAPFVFRLCPRRQIVAWSTVGHTKDVTHTVSADLHNERGPKGDWEADVIPRGKPSRKSSRRLYSATALRSGENLGPFVPATSSVLFKI